MQDQLQSMGKCWQRFVEGMANICASSFRDYVGTEMHQKAMALFKQRQFRERVRYAPITKSLAQVDVRSLTVLKKKFDIAYFIVKEKLANHFRVFQH